MKKLSFILLILTACGPAPASDPFQIYRARWVEEGFPTTELVNIAFAPLDPKYYGICAVGGNSRTVNINIGLWDEMSPEDREHLLFHEFAHCILGLLHADSIMMIDGCPDNIMDSYLYSNCYKSHKELYLNKLRNRIMN